MTFSVNNKLILEQYIKSAVKSEIRSGIATPGQRDMVKGLTVLMDAKLSDGRHIPKGSVAYIREEILHNHSMTIFKPLTCDTISGKFMVVELQYIEFFDILSNDAA